ncbi:MAG: oligosaccharide flippase family protein [candidate division Zixibacteria bacterium]|nr:oligosaccharide flippase family protein [candidate division Zixibacteria bacterium]
MSPSLLRVSSVYAAGLVINRGLDFAFLPLYTHLFSPEEYGAVALCLVLLAFGHVVYAMGFGPAFVRVAAMAGAEQAGRLFPGITVVLAVTATIFSSTLIIGSDVAAAWLGIADHAGMVVRTAVVLFLDVWTLLPYSLMRAGQQAGRFVACTTAATLVHITGILYFVVYSQTGPEGLFNALIAASFFNAIFSTVAVRRQIRLRPTFSDIGSLARFGLPFVPAGVASVAIELIDRILLERFTDTATVGVYSAAARLASGMGLIVKAFDYAWTPYVLSQNRDTDRVMRKGMTGLVVMTTPLWTVFWLFGENLIRWEGLGLPLLGPAYVAGISVVPVLMGAGILNGLAEGLTARIYLKGDSKLVPLATIAGAGVNVAANLALIPVWGMQGAAYATVLAYAVALIILWVGLRKNP